MKKERLQNVFLDELRRLPVVAAVCEKLDVSRNAVYTWRKKDPAFAKAMDEALVEGEQFIIEVAETKLLSLIEDGHWPAVSFILTKRSAKYKERLELSGSLKTGEVPLTPEQEAKLRKVLGFDAENPKKK